jgi:hypothetical protein
MSACVHTRLVTPAATAGVDLPPPASVVSVMWNVPEELHREFGYGDVWTWTGLCADTKLVPIWLVGERGGFDAEVFMRDLASRLVHPVQLTTDGHRAHLEAVESAFGADIDYAVLHKRADYASSRQRLTMIGQAEQIVAAVNKRAVRWILSIPNIGPYTACDLDIAKPAADEVPGVADIHVPNF